LLCSDGNIGQFQALFVTRRKYAGEFSLSAAPIYLICDRTAFLLKIQLIRCKIYITTRISKYSFLERKTWIFLRNFVPFAKIRTIVKP
jgi:hypothetical protein